MKEYTDFLVIKNINTETLLKEQAPHNMILDFYSNKYEHTKFINTHYEWLLDNNFIKENNNEPIEKITIGTKLLLTTIYGDVYECVFCQISSGELIVISPHSFNRMFDTIFYTSKDYTKSDILNIINSDFYTNIEIIN